MSVATTWFGDRLSRWPVVPIRRVCQLGTGHTPDRSQSDYWRAEECVIPWVTVADIHRLGGSGLEPLDDTEQHISETGLANSAAVLHPTGTVMVSRTASIGFACRIGRPMATTQAFATWTPGPMVDGRYLLLVMKALAPEFDRLAYGSTHLTIYMPDIEGVRMPVPPTRTQRAIADYVEREIARIDALIAAKQRIVELLEERLHLTARESTTNGGETLPLRRILSTIKTGTTPPVEEFSRLSEGAVPWYSPADVGDWLQLLPASRTLKTEAIAAGWVPQFPAQSTLLVGIGATAGKVAFLDHGASGNQQMTCLVPGPRILPRFLAWQLFARRDELCAAAPFTTLPILSNEFVKSLLMVIPALPRQAELVDHLDQEAATVQSLASRARAQASLLSERRLALITAAVTGQLDIPEAA